MHCMPCIHWRYAPAYSCGVNRPTLCESKDDVHFFTRSFECHNRYNKLLLCNSKNGDIASRNRNTWEGFFLRFFLKRRKTCFFSKNTIIPELKKHKRLGGMDFIKKNGFFSTLIIFQSFSAIFPWSCALEQVRSRSVWLGVARTLTSIGPCY